MRVYLDSAPVIYLLESHPVFGPRVAAWLAANATALVSSDLTRLETLVVPVRAGDATRIADFEDFFRIRVAELVPFTRPLFDRATQVRAAHGFKTPDALHLAAAVEGQCDAFLTNDLQLKQFTGVAVEVI